MALDPRTGQDVPQIGQQEAGYFSVPVPGLEHLNVFADFRQGTPDAEIQQGLMKIREQHREQLDMPNLPSTEWSPFFGSLTGATAGAAFVPPPWNIPAAGLLGLGGYALGRGHQEYRKMTEPSYHTATLPQGRELPVPAPTPPLQEMAQEIVAQAPFSFGFPAVTEAIAPQAGKLAHEAGRRTGFRPFAGTKEWLARKFMLPEKMTPEVQRLQDIDAIIRQQKVGGKAISEGLPISRMTGEESKWAPSAMEAIAHGGFGSPIKQPLVQAEKALEQFGGTLAKKGWPDLHTAGQEALRGIERAEEKVITGPQSSVYNRIRKTIPPQTRFVDAEAAIQALQNPDDRFAKVVLNELNELQRSKPVATSLINLVQSGSAKQLGGLTFDESVTLRSALYKAGRKMTGVDDPTFEAEGLAGIRLGAQLSDQIKEGVGKLNPGLRTMLEQVDKQAFKYKDFYNDRSAMKLRAKLEADPEFLFRELSKPTNTEHIKALRRMMDPEAAKAGRWAISPNSPWFKVQEWLSSELIRDTTAAGKVDASKLKRVLENYTEPTTTYLFDPKMYRDLQRLAEGLEVTQAPARGPFHVAIQLMTPQAVTKSLAAVGVLAGGTVGYQTTQRTGSPTAGVLAGLGTAGAILMAPQAFKAILMNPSLRDYFVKGVWEYRKTGVPGPGLRAAIRQAGAAAAREVAQAGFENQEPDTDIEILPQTPTQPTPSSPAGASPVPPPLGIQRGSGR